MIASVKEYIFQQKGIYIEIDAHFIKSDVRQIQLLYQAFNYIQSVKGQKVLHRSNQSRPSFKAMDQNQETIESN